MLELAKSGKVNGIPFAANTGLTDDVDKSWGKADKSESAGSGIYATYTKKNAVIGFNKGSQIIDIRSNDPKLHTLTLSQIEQALGKPTDTKVNGDDTIYIYKASQEFQLKFIIPKSTGKVDHISVFDTIHSINNMAG
ncbi:YjgB family protein [Paenibacillus sp. Soil766]|uniref:YjgB family protein n=1 Tax=Paenibacillus sp. Soil766 TaxID=1736404 RepID=UPI001F36DA64|nr:YjgB family protein [Paenibacillus sp. Soil766]